MKSGSLDEGGKRLSVMPYTRYDEAPQTTARPGSTREAYSRPCDWRCRGICEDGFSSYRVCQERWSKRRQGASIYIISAETPRDSASSGKEALGMQIEVVPFYLPNGPFLVRRHPLLDVKIPPAEEHSQEDALTVCIAARCGNVVIAASAQHPR